MNAKAKKAHARARLFSLKPRPSCVYVEANFVDDLRAIACRLLVDNGYSVDSAATTETLVHNWLKVRHRQISVRVRRVEWSRELTTRKDALPAWIVDALERVQADVAAGHDLNPYLSRQLVSDKAFKRTDYMLNELGVHHFHLGEGTDAAGQILGTKELLFATVTDDAVYFIDVFDHSSFGDERTFRTAQSNWPHVFESSRLHLQPSRSEAPLSPEQRAAVRKKHWNVPVTAADGTLFHPPGGGLTCAGTAPRIVFAADQIFDRVKAWETWCKENGPTLGERLRAARGRTVSRLHLRLEGIDETGTFHVVDDAAGVGFNLKFEEAPGVSSAEESAAGRALRS